jgi:hypothetical protein
MAVLPLVPRGTPRLDPLIATAWLAALFATPEDPHIPSLTARPMFAPALHLLLALCANPLGAMFAEHLVRSHLMFADLQTRLENDERRVEQVARRLAASRRETLRQLCVWMGTDLPEAVEYGWIALLSNLPGVARAPRRRRQKPPQENFDGATP